MLEVTTVSDMLASPDENTAIVVEGDEFTVIGQSCAVIYSTKPSPA